MVVAVAWAALLPACRHQPPEQELIEKVEPVGAWISTLQMTGEKWAANSIPDSFVGSCAKAARKAFEQADKDARKSQARPDLRDALRQLIAESTAAADRLQKASRDNDRNAAMPAARQLAALGVRFQALEKAAGGAP